MKNVLYLIIIFLVISCNRKPETFKYFDREKGVYVLDTLPYNSIRDYPKIRRCKNPDFLIKGIVEANFVYESAIGIGGIYPKQYARFERLTELLDEIQMFELIKHENPIVRVYAYKGLSVKKSKLIDKAEKILERDTAQFNYQTGCLIWTNKVSEYITPKE
ncbi:hypothetical protein [Aquimarina rubra]|uniref:Uncharacterized protein n=1 Tax=Aquimarina rubra TaxID=1920033 RepID=A0ABW5LFE8_9FLAO